MAKKTRWILLAILVVLGWLWYAIRSGMVAIPWLQLAHTKQLDTDAFNKEHDHDMTEKQHQEENTVETPVTTVSLLAPTEKVAVTAELVEYTPGTKWFMVYPTDNPQAPWVVIIHERWGLNDHIKDMARVIAMNGYRVLAVDLYKWNVATAMEQAQELSKALNQEESTKNLLAAETFLRQYAKKVWSLGWCLGWKQSLELSLASDTLDATVIYYGRLYDDPTILAKINQPLLWIFAEKDNGIPPSAVEGFQKGLVSAGKTWDITIYPNVWHAFANPTGNNFNKDATVDAWAKTLAFLKANLQ